MSGERYELTAMAELIALYRKLPAGRGDVMLEEVTRAVRYSAALLEAVGGVATAAPGYWIDDDLGELTVPAYDSTTGEPIAEMRVAKDVTA